MDLYPDTQSFWPVHKLHDALRALETTPSSDVPSEVVGSEDEAQEVGMTWTAFASAFLPKGRSRAT